jgi:threonine dehydrogenase-like Zn-dependent dehydrogenase
LRALVVATAGSISLRDVPSPPYEGECLVRVLRAGICGTDLQILQGYASFEGIPGHEFVGVVDDASSPADAHWVGKRVVGEINVGCGRCDWCTKGEKEHCVARSVVGIRERGGAFAEFLSLPADNLHEVPASIDDDAAVFVEPAAAACRILEQIPLAGSERIAVLGDGRMGLLVAQVLTTAAADVTVLGHHHDKLDVARSLGLDAHHADMFRDDEGRFDVVVDVTGRPAGVARALELVHPRGTVVLKSTFHGEAPLAPWPIVVNEVTLVGSRCGPFPRALDLLASGAVRVAPLISAVVPLEDYAAAFSQARRALKVIFRP